MFQKNIAQILKLAITSDARAFSSEILARDALLFLLWLLACSIYPPLPAAKAHEYNVKS